MCTFRKLQLRRIPSPSVDDVRPIRADGSLLELALPICGVHFSAVPIERQEGLTTSEQGSITDGTYQTSFPVPGNEQP